MNAINPLNANNVPGKFGAAGGSAGRCSMAISRHRRANRAANRKISGAIFVTGQ